MTKASSLPAGGEERLRALLSNQWWRLNNLYYIKDKYGKQVRFKPNAAQTKLYEGMHEFNVILKARQLGFSTFIEIYSLDCALFGENQAVGVISHTKDDAEDLFDNKVKFAYDKLQGWLKEAVPATADAARKMKFENGSSITIGTSLRGGTFQILHVSEYGKIAARYPDKAVEIKTGALNTVHVGQRIFIESTAEGNQGEFFDLCERGRRLQEQGAELTPMDPKLFFFPWFDEPTYELKGKDIDNTSINAELEEYFKRIEKECKIELTPGQKAWYVKKSESMGEYMKREFPSTVLEAFEQSMEGAYYTKQMSLVRTNGQICSVPHDPRHKVYTFWDLGLNDDTVIWFFQYINGKRMMIDYHESNGEGWDYYAKLLMSKPYVYDEHVWPHDGNKRIMGQQVQTGRQLAMELGINPIRVVPRTTSVGGDINNYVKPAIPMTWFDEKRCAQGIKHLDNYRKEWDDKRGVWKERPLHDEASHGADAFRTYAVAFDKLPISYMEQDWMHFEHVTSVPVEQDVDPFNL